MTLFSIEETKKITKNINNNINYTTVLKTQFTEKPYPINVTSPYPDVNLYVKDILRHERNFIMYGEKSKYKPALVPKDQCIVSMKSDKEYSFTYNLDVLPRGQYEYFAVPLIDGIESIENKSNSGLLKNEPIDIQISITQGERKMIKTEYTHGAVFEFAIAFPFDFLAWDGASKYVGLKDENFVKFFKNYRLLVHTLSGPDKLPTKRYAHAQHYDPAKRRFIFKYEISENDRCELKSVMQDSQKPLFFYYLEHNESIQKTVISLPNNMYELKLVFPFNFYVVSSDKKQIHAQDEYFQTILQNYTLAISLASTDKEERAPAKRYDAIQRCLTFAYQGSEIPSINGTPIIYNAQNVKVNLDAMSIELVPIDVVATSKMLIKKIGSFKL